MGSRRIEESRRSGKRAGREAVHHIRDARRPPAHSTGSPTCGPRASGPLCAQRLERPEAGETPAVHQTRDAREQTSTRPTARGPVDRGPLASSPTERREVGEVPSNARRRGPSGVGTQTPIHLRGGRDARGPPHARRPRANEHASNGSRTSGPRASGPPCVQRLEPPEAGETPAVHHTRDDRGPPHARRPRATKREPPRAAT